MTVRQGVVEDNLDFIAKPFSIAQLLVRLENVCSVRQLREQNVRLQEQLDKGRPITGCGAGTGISAKFAEAGWESFSTT